MLIPLRHLPLPLGLLLLSIQPVAAAGFPIFTLGSNLEGSGRFGIHRTVPPEALDLAIWTPSEDGTMVWRLGIESPGAASIRARVERWPSAAGRLSVRSGASGRLLAAYDWTPGYTQPLSLWTAPAEGSSLLLEFAPASESSRAVPLRLPEISHHFALSAASCQTGVACNSAWADASASVALLAIEKESGPVLCTGTLVATADKSRKPYFLTAGSCVASKEEAASAVTYWNYQANSCQGTAASRGDSTRIDGASLLVTRDAADGDYSLLELPSLPDNATFAEWDATAEPAIGAPLVSIHHPGGGAKSLATGVRVEDQPVDGRPSEKYFTVDFDKGRMDAASLGAPLFTAEGKLAGFATNLISTAADGQDICALSPFRVGFGRFSTAYPALRRYLDPAGRPRFLAPTEGIALTSGSVTFTWTAGAADIAEFSLAIGYLPDTSDIYFQGQGTQLSVALNHLPIDGSRLYVRLFARTGSEWQVVDNLILRTLPLPDLVPYLGGFTPATGPNGERLGQVGGYVVNSGYISSPAFRIGFYFVDTRNDLPSAERFLGSCQPTAEPAPGGIGICQVSIALPADANPGNHYIAVVADDLNRIPEMDETNNVLMSSVIQISVAGMASMVSPAPASRLDSDTATFTWSAGSAAARYRLRIGSTKGAADLFSGPEQTELSRTVTGLPVDGRYLYVQLSSLIAGTWFDLTYVYQAAVPVAAELTSPTGSPLGSATVTFSWNAGRDVSAYWLKVGLTRGGTEIYSSAATTALSADVRDIPLDGRYIYVRLSSRIVGDWVDRDYIFQTALPAVPFPARLTSPTGTRLDSWTVIFFWSAGRGVTDYWLKVGITPGGTELYSSSPTTGLSATVLYLPVNGRTIYVRLLSRIRGVWSPIDYQFTAADIPGLPDLVVSEVSAPTAVQAGMPLPGVHARVDNLGSGDADPVFINFFLSRSPDGSTLDVDLYYMCDGPALLAGYFGTCTVTPVVPPDLAPGTYYPIVVANVNHDVLESDPTNNTAVAAQPLIVSPNPHPPLIYGVDIDLEGTILLANNVKLQSVIHLAWYGTSYQMSITGTEDLTASRLTFSGQDQFNFSGDTITFNAEVPGSFVINHGQTLALSSGTFTLRLSSSTVGSAATADLQLRSGATDLSTKFEGTITRSEHI